METTATVRDSGSLQRRRIIERPRLFALLDQSTARVRTLVAPAGYGKTTLADQWVARDGRRAAWYTARRSSTDVAALALGLARVASSLVEGCDLRLREHLRAVPAPGEHVDVLAEILGEDLQGWPQECWIVFDEYQQIACAPRAERFVEALVTESPVQLLVASRQRPSWITARRILYGEFLELNQTMLAMDGREAAEVLAGRSAPSASGLVAIANGWPAVIGLASVSSAEIEGEDPLPESLYEFFGEEVFGALGDDVRAGLATLAVAPVLDRELALELLGGDRVATVCSAALDVGVLTEREAQLELHPLARSFLDERGLPTGLLPRREAASRCLVVYRKRRDWDAAFELISHNELPDELEPLLQGALDELLETARLRTIETWCDLASDWGLDSPAFAVARAEVALRRGRHGEAQAFAEAAAAPERPDLVLRALSVAGRAAHLASREADALELYRRAERAARTDGEHRDALWGQFLCAVELELPEAEATLHELSAGTGLADPRDAVRAAACGLSYQVKLGSLDLAQADLAYELLGAVADPLVESSFQNVYAAVLALSARYEEALEIAAALLATARRYRLDFAVPYGLSVLSTANAGLRRWQPAARYLDEALASARSGRNAYAEQVCYAVRVRTLAQQGKQRAALAVPVPDLRSSLPAARAEVLGSRALVLASVGRIAEAASVVDEIRGSTRAVEPTVLVAATDAIASIKRREPKATATVAELEETAFSRGAVDLLVAAYRSAPELLAVLLRGRARSERVVDLLRRARDEDLARKLGHAIALDDDPRERLSPREREVYDLIRQGLTNRQIAELLFISEGTVKVHAHHVYDKVGTRSRAALAVQAALERADHATSATADPASATDDADRGSAS
jgi:LuxR family maltose regulon positive regulatory protein